MKANTNVEQTVLGNCPTCGGPACFLTSDEGTNSVQHVDLRSAARENFRQEVMEAVERVRKNRTAPANQQWGWDWALDALKAELEGK